ncbi:tyrosine-type recombinase/integrase [Intestinibacter bartlettii]|uniref:tyrosine-type recombinase/integrase n=1 Tax=Bacillota TaxID=1239 RepID=UPI003BA92E27
MLAINILFKVINKSFIKRCNLRYIRSHPFRHAHATLLLAYGNDIKTVSERLGHSSIEITMDIYIHVLKELDKKSSDNISNLLFKNTI